MIFRPEKFSKYFITFHPIYVVRYQIYKNFAKNTEAKLKFSAHVL